MAAATRRILYVDADAEARLLMQDLLATYAIDVTGSDEEARVLARRNSYDVYLISGGPDETALALCEWLHRIDASTPIIYCSSTGSAQHQGRAIAAGALRYHVKPLDPVLLRSTLGLLLKLADIESNRARIVEQMAIQDELTARAARAFTTTQNGQEKARQSLDSTLRIKAYRAFREAGGNRANFERLWQMLEDSEGPSETPPR